MVANLKLNIAWWLTRKTLAASSAFRPSLVMTTLSGDQFTGKPVQRRELLRGSVGGDTMWQTKPPRKVGVELCSKGRYDRLYRCET